MNMRAGFTITKCPGCGQNNERKKDSVCPECHKHIETGKMHIELYKKYSNDENYIEVQIPTNWEKPNILSNKIQKPDSYNEIGKTLKELIHEISFVEGIKPYYPYMQYLENRLVFEEIDSHGSKTHVAFQNDRAYDRFYSHGATAIINKQILQKLEKLHSLFQLALNETEQEAIEKGKDVLFLLHQGKITMADFDKM